MKALFYVVDMHVTDIIAANVSRLLNLRNMKIKTFATESGIPYGNVYRVVNPETSNPTLKNVQAVADALKVPVWVLCLPTESKLHNITNQFIQLSPESQKLIANHIESLLKLESPKKQPKIYPIR